MINGIIIKINRKHNKYIFMLFLIKMIIKVK